MLMEDGAIVHVYRRRRDVGLLPLSTSWCSVKKAADRRPQYSTGWRHGDVSPFTFSLEKIGFEFHAVGSVSAAKVMGGQRYREYLRSRSGRWVGYFQARRSVSCRRSSQSDGRQAESQDPG